MDLHTFRTTFDPRFTAKIREFITEEEAILQDPFLAQLLRHTEVLLHGGKRLRPYMTWLGYTAARGNAPEIPYAMGIALEFFHGFCLVHDDIMDKASTRRGVPTIEAKAYTLLTEARRHGNHKHIAQSHAILIGDLLFAWSMDCAIDAGKHQFHALSEFHHMVKEVVGGQMIDIDTTTREESDLALLERKMYLKTAGYSFVRPLALGVRLAAPHNAPELLRACQSIGTALGLAFQLQDDLFDVTKTEAELGKPTLSDIRDGQQTYLTAYVATHGTAEEQLLLRTVMRGQGTTEDLQRLTEIFVHRGACEQTTQRIAELFTTATQAIQAATFETPVRETLLTFTRTLQERSS